MIDFERILFNIDIPATIDAAAGTLLVAEPFLKEECFAHSVIYIVDHASDSSSMGVVLNHITRHRLSDLIDGIDSAHDTPVFCGGPVGTNRLFFMHTLGDIIPQSQEIGSGMYIGGDFDYMRQYINAGYPTEGKIRFFIGYSGWSARQLEDEIQSNVWAVSGFKSAERLLKEHGDSYWHRTVRSMDSRFRGWLYHPQNPHAN
ncbi:YqgE/AlgH family protein [Paramuribaculum intestinale]|uniref:YqgE/AlgH family protein n=1 Tax=Paramuribaculum intestinale TaxID=2094151 RepID=UPI0025B424B4|nr:YqgE/AlgH family protein [Paramuribaculum intestinale]